MNDAIGGCRDCRAKLRRGRLCAAHFHDFLGWLAAMSALRRGHDRLHLESFFWAFPRRRGELIALYVRDAAVDEVTRVVFGARRAA